MNQDRLLNMLGLAMRAGQLVTGEEAVVKEIRSQNAKLVFVAQDAGKNTHKKVQDKSNYYEISFFDGLTQTAISQAIGRPRTVIAVMDAGFAKKMKELIQD